MADDHVVLVKKTTSFYAQIYNGGKSKNFTIWNKQALVVIGTFIIEGENGYKITLGMDQGGTAPGAPAYNGNAANIAIQTAKHELRTQRVSSMWIANLKEGCSLRERLADPANPFLNDAFLCHSYIVQECLLALSSEEIFAEKKMWESISMDDHFGFDNLGPRSMHEFIEFVQKTAREMNTVPPENEVMLTIIRGLSPKLGNTKILLLSADCPTRLKFPNALGALAQNLGPPIVIAQIARAAGDFRPALLISHLNEQYKLGIENKTIHIKKKTTDVNAIYKGKKPFQKKKGQYQRSGDKGATSRDDKKDVVTKGKVVVCFKCGGLFHTATQCATADDAKPSVKTLTSIKYPTEIVFRWPKSFYDTSKGSVHHVDDFEKSSSSEEEDEQEESGEDDEDSSAEDEAAVHAMNGMTVSRIPRIFRRKGKLSK